MMYLQVKDGVTITSNMIAELTGKKHNKVMRDIRVIIENIGIKKISPDLAPSTYIDNANRVKSNYTLSKDGLMLVITKYSDEHRFKLIKYARELEEQLRIQNLPSYQIENRIDRANKWIEEEQVRQALENKIEKDKPLVNFAKAVGDSSNAILVRELAKVISTREGIKIGQNKLYNKMREWGMILKNTTEPTQKAIDNGYLIVTERTIRTIFDTRTVRTSKVTGKGQIYIYQKLHQKEMI